MFLLCIETKRWMDGGSELENAAADDRRLTDVGRDGKLLRAEIIGRQDFLVYYRCPLGSSGNFYWGALGHEARHSTHHRKKNTVSLGSHKYTHVLTLAHLFFRKL